MDIVTYSEPTCVHACRYSEIDGGGSGLMGGCEEVKMGVIGRCHFVEMKDLCHSTL